MNAWLNPKFEAELHAEIDRVVLDLLRKRNEAIETACVRALKEGGKIVRIDNYNDGTYTVQVIPGRPIQILDVRHAHPVSGATYRCVNCESLHA